MTHSLHLPRLPDLSHLSKASSSWLATLGVGLAIGLPIHSAAQPLDDSEDERPRPSWARWLDPNAERPPRWMGENLFYKKGTGLEFRQEAKLGQNPIEVGIPGPLLRKTKDPSGFANPNRPRRMSGMGVTIEVRF
jgi:hypothetical protein